MPFLSELTSWLPLLNGPSLSAVPSIGSPAPSHAQLPFPSGSKKPALISFLRHCGCPYAEKTFIILRALAAKHPELDIIAVSHSDEDSTRKWLADIGGPSDKGSSQEVRIVVDAKREIYAAWGLGAGGLLSVLNGRSLGGVGKLEKEEGIKIRDTLSGSRWQKAGSFAVDAQGLVRWAVVAESAEEIGDFEEAISLVEGK